MPVYLLDLNVLFALAWPDHVSHKQAGRWFARYGEVGWATCPFTQAGLVRLLSNPAFSPAAIPVEAALAVLDANVKLPGHHFWPANISLRDAVKDLGRLTGHKQISDAYLVGLAIRHRGKLATLDRGISVFAPSDAVEEIA